MTDELRKELKLKAIDVREGILTATHGAKAGHPGGSLSAADVFTYLYNVEMNIDPKDPKKEDRDRFVLSKGHNAPGLYAALAHRGFFPVEDLPTFRSLGQGLSVACGMAKGAKYLEKSFRVYALMGDGEIEEGQIWEAAMFAAHYKLDNLCAIVDLNGLQIDGPTAVVMNSAPVDEKFKAFGFEVITVNGGDFDDLEKAFDFFHKNIGSGKPTAILMKTLKGQGVSYMEGQVGWHGKAPNDAEYEQGINELEAARKAIEEV